MRVLSNPRALVGRERQRPRGGGGGLGQRERTGPGAEGGIGDLSQGVSPRASESPEGTEKRETPGHPQPLCVGGGGELSGWQGGHSRPRRVRRRKECKTRTSGHKTPLH